MQFFLYDSLSLMARAIALSGFLITGRLFDTRDSRLALAFALFAGGSSFRLFEMRFIDLKDQWTRD
jgi:hypothetical protein